MCKITLPITEASILKMKSPLIDQYQYSIEADQHFDDLSESDTIMSCGSLTNESADCEVTRRAKSVDEANGDKAVDSQKSLTREEETASPKRNRRQASRSPRRKHSRKARSYPSTAPIESATLTRGDPSIKRASRSLSPSIGKSSSSDCEQNTNRQARRLQPAATLDGANLGSNKSSEPHALSLQKAAALEDSKKASSSRSLESGIGPARRLTKSKSIIQQKQIKHGLELQDQFLSSCKESRPCRRSQERPSHRLAGKQNSHRTTRQHSPHSKKSGASSRHDSNALLLAEQTAKVAALTKTVQDLQEELAAVHQELNELKEEKSQRSSSVTSLSSSHSTHALQKAIPTLVSIKEFSKRPFTWKYTKRSNDDSMACLEG